jgi:hypothetical protein
MTRKPSCLISCSHSLPEGSLSVLLGRHGAMNPVGQHSADSERLYPRRFNSFLIAPLTVLDIVGVP